MARVQKQDKNNSKEDSELVDKLVGIGMVEN